MGMIKNDNSRLVFQKKYPLSDELKENFKTFNKRVGILPLKYIEYEIVNNDIIFKDLEY